MKKKTNILLIVLVFLTIISGISILFYNNLKSSNKTIEVEAIVKEIGSEYIVLEDYTGKEYSLKLDDAIYNVGDRVDFLLKDCKDKERYVEGTLVKIDTVSQNINICITDEEVKEEDNSNENNSNSTEDTTVKGTVTNDTNVKDNNTLVKAVSDDEIVAYFTEFNNSLDTYKENSNIKEELKSKFITVVDFLFYDGEIKGKTFKELSDKAKLKVLQLSLSIDEKIDKHFPGYKEKISTTTKKVYTNVKAKVLEAYLNTTTKVCAEKTELCESAKNGLKDLKASFSLTWDYIKEFSGITVTKLKEWYKIWKET